MAQWREGSPPTKCSGLLSFPVFAPSTKTSISKFQFYQGGGLYSPRSDPDPERIPNPEMIPKSTPK